MSTRPGTLVVGVLLFASAVPRLAAQVSVERALCGGAVCPTPVELASGTAVTVVLLGQQLQDVQRAAVVDRGGNSVQAVAVALGLTRRDGSRPVTFTAQGGTVELTGLELVLETSRGAAVHSAVWVAVPALATETLDVEPTLEPRPVPTFPSAETRYYADFIIPEIALVGVATKPGCTGWPAWCPEYPLLDITVTNQGTGGGEVSFTCNWRHRTGNPIGLFHVIPLGSDLISQTRVGIYDTTLPPGGAFKGRLAFYEDERPDPGDYQVDCYVLSGDDVVDNNWRRRLFSVTRQESDFISEITVAGAAPPPGCNGCALLPPYFDITVKNQGTWEDEVGVRCDASPVDRPSSLYKLRWIDDTPDDWVGKTLPPGASFTGRLGFYSDGMPGLGDHFIDCYVDGDGVEENNHSRETFSVVPP